MGNRRFIACLFLTLLAVSPTAAQSNAPLADAAEKMERAKLGALLKQGSAVNASQADGMTALHWAVYQDDLPTARLLVDAGANVKAANHYGVEPLSLACANGNTEIVELLLKTGADPNAALRGGETTLMTAARTGKTGPVQALLAHGADVNAKDRKGQTALMWAAADGHAAVVKALLAAGAEFKTPLPSGFTPLLFAAREGRTDVIHVLLKVGADVNETLQPKKPAPRGPKAGNSPLTLAIENGHFELAIELVKAGATPYLAAASTADIPLLKKLVELGADPLLPNSQGTTPLMAAAGVGVGAPEEAAGTEPEVLEAVELLLKLGADVNAVDKNGETAMHGAAYRNHPKVVQLLADRGAKIEIWNRPNKTGLTPVVIAEGHRPGLNFRPAPETLAALHRVMLAAGVTPPRTSLPGAAPKSGYGEGAKKLGP